MIQIVEAPEGLKLITIHITPKPSLSDPLGQRGYLAIKFEGGLSVVTAGVPKMDEEHLIGLRDELAKRVEAALREALKRPDETVFSMSGAC